MILSVPQCSWSPLHSWLPAPFKSLGMAASVAASFPAPSTPGENLPVLPGGLCSICCHPFTEEAFQNPSVQSLSRVQLFATPWTAAQQASPSITNSQSLLKLISIQLVMPSNHLILCGPLLPPSIFSQHKDLFK